MGTETLLERMLRVVDWQVRGEEGGVRVERSWVAPEACSGLVWDGRIRGVVGVESRVSLCT